MSDPAILIAAHGSRDDSGAREALAMALRVSALAADVEVGCGFIELSSPPISAAVAELISSGARDIVVVPAMLFAAGHTKNDIPAVIARERLRHPGVSIRYGRNFGIHPDLLALVDERVEEKTPASEAQRTAVLLVGRGSSDPDANSDLFKIARLFHEGRPYPFVESCFVGISPPFVREGLERCRRLGAERVVVVPYFLFTGLLVERVVMQCGEFAAAHPQMQVAVARHLWPDDRIARLVLERYGEAIDGDPRMNCDVCIHRVALAGFEEKVGAPATPHDHPDEHLHPLGENR